MAPKSVTFRRHEHLVSVLFGDLFGHSYNITFSMFFSCYIQYRVYLMLGSVLQLNISHERKQKQLYKHQIADKSNRFGIHPLIVNESGEQSYTCITTVG